MKTITVAEVKALYEAELAKLLRRKKGYTIRTQTLAEDDKTWVENVPVVVAPHDEVAALQKDVDALEAIPEKERDKLYPMHLERAKAKVADYSPEKQARQALRTELHVKLVALNPPPSAETLPEGVKGTKFATPDIVHEFQKVHHADLWELADSLIASAFGEPAPLPALRAPGGNISGVGKMSSTLSSTKEALGAGVDVAAKK